MGAYSFTTEYAPSPADRGDSWRHESVISIVGDIREVFEAHFERAWFAVLIDDLPMERQVMSDIRRLLGLHFYHEGDEYIIMMGIQQLEHFVAVVRRYLLPVLRDELGVSGFKPGRAPADKRDMIIRKMCLYTFPHNLKRLEQLTVELKQTALLVFPKLIA
jgi:hypothetical protein